MIEKNLIQLGKCKNKTAQNIQLRSAIFKFSLQKHRVYTLLLFVGILTLT